MTVTLDDHLQLNASVSLRPERFGALAYSFTTRKLSFLKHPDLVRVVSSLDGSRTVGQAFEAAEIDAVRSRSFLTALAALVDSKMLESVVGEPVQTALQGGSVSVEEPV